MPMPLLGPYTATFKHKTVCIYDHNKYDIIMMMTKMISTTFINISLLYEALAYAATAT